MEAYYQLYWFWYTHFFGGLLPAHYWLTLLFRLQQLSLWRTTFTPSPQRSETAGAPFFDLWTLYFSFAFFNAHRGGQLFSGSHDRQGNYRHPICHPDPDHLWVDGSLVGHRLWLFQKKYSARIVLPIALCCGFL